MADPAELVGTPFQHGARGPDKFDCYGLVMHIMRSKHGVQLPDFRAVNDQAVIAANFANGVQVWEKTEERAGSVALFRIGRYISHCGYMLDDMRMIHTWDKSGGVVIERVDTWQQRTVGFYRYVGHSKQG